MILVKKKIHEIKYYILYNYKSALEAIVSNFSHSSMITPHSLLREIISVLVLSIEPVSGDENPCLIISTSTLLVTVDSIDSTEIHFIINLKDRQINGIMFVRNSAITERTLLKKYCQLIVFVPHH